MREPQTGATPMMLAAATGDTGTIATLRAAGARLDEHALNGMTPLMAAAYKNQRDAAVLLMRWGADIAAADTGAVRAAGYAKLGDAAECVTLFADVDRLYDFCARGARDSVQALIARGVPVQVVNRGRTPLDVAKQNHHGDVAKLLEVAAHGK